MTERPRIREILLWSCPALLVGLVLRLMLAFGLPYAYMQHDSVRLLIAGAEWLPADDFDTMSNNVPALVPTLYRLALGGPIPALISIQIFQHLLGLIQIALAGIMIACWSQRWKWWIVLGTLLIAVHPSLLWFEHTVMLEAIYVFTVVALAAAGSWLITRPSLGAAAVLSLCTWAVAITRPEGKLFVPVALLFLVIAFWARWRQMAIATGMFAVTLVGIAFGTVRGESGLLLYSSVIHLSPAVSKAYPDAAPYVQPLREDAIARAAQGPAFVSRPQREALTEALTRFVNDHPEAGRGETASDRMDHVAKKLGYEACLQAPWHLPGLAMLKFRATADQLASGKFTKNWLHDRQVERLRNSLYYLAPIVVQLYGEKVDRDNISAFVQRHYRPENVRWFGALHDEWSDLYNRKLAATKFPSLTLEGLPKFYFLPLLGLLLGMVRAHPSRPFHLTWGAMLAGLWLIVMVTANERSRFRMAFEPFLFLYPVVLLDTTIPAAVALVRRRNAGAAQRPAPQQQPVTPAP